MDKLLALKLFAKVVQEGSLSAAGRQTGLSTASVSRHISSLEDALGARLLNRSSRSVVLTDAGSTYYARIERILREIQEADENAQNVSNSPAGELKVHSSVQVGCNLIAPTIPRFIAAFPNVDLELQVSDSAVNLVRDNFDLDIRIGKLDDSALIARRITNTELIVCASPDYLRRHDRPATPRDLVAHNCLTYRVERAPSIWRFLRNQETDQIRVDGDLKSNNGEILRIAAVAGVGVVMLRDWALAEDLKAGRLEMLLPDYRASYSIYDNGLYAVYHQGRHPPEKLRVFIDFLVQELRPMTAARLLPLSSAG